MRRSHLLFLIPAATVLLYACDSTDDEHKHEPTSDIGDVVLEGDVTDETFVALESALDQGAPLDNVAQGGTLDAPPDSAELPRTPAALFSWHFGAAASRVPAAAARRLAWQAPWSPSWDLSPPREPAASEAFMGPLLELIGPMRSAHAHGTPYTGTATYLRFSIGSNPKVVEVFTSNTTYTPASDLWAKLTGAGEPITLSLVSAVFEENRVAQDGGPFAGSTITFTVTP